MYDLEPFDDEHRCLKCGQSPVMVKWRSANNEGTNAFGFPIPARPERLENECHRCGYSWESQTADTAPEQVPASR